MALTKISDSVLIDTTKIVAIEVGLRGSSRVLLSGGHSVIIEGSPIQVAMDLGVYE